MMDGATLLPVVFAGLMGLAILVYVILDGFDLGIGLLFPLADPADRDRLVAAIGPFWDANETWLVLAVGLLLVAFPIAHGVILSALYLPVAVMLVGLILRGVAFEFRAKAPVERKPRWDAAFFAGSLLAALAQGFMLARYIMGLSSSGVVLAFGVLVALCLAVAYALIGATWLILKTEGRLRARAVGWARGALWGAAAGMAAVSAVTPLVSDRLWQKWTSWPEILWLAPLPVAALATFLALWRALAVLPPTAGRGDGRPFRLAAVLYALGFAGMAYSFFPYVVPDQLTIWQAAAAPESLRVILVGAVLVMPMIVGYTLLSYRVFRGPAAHDDYD